MNHLSWLIYWANTLPNLASAIGVVATLLSAAFSIAVFIRILAISGGESDAKGYIHATRFLPYFTPIVMLIGLASSLVPDKEAFYLIAASEMGQTVTETPEFSKLRTILNNILDEQVENTKSNRKEA